MKICVRKKRRPRRPNRRAAALLLTVFLAVAAPPPASPAQTVLIDRVVATVNGEVITLYELYKAEIPIFGRIYLPEGPAIKSPEERAKERDLLDRLIEEKLFVRRARERGISVNPGEVDEAIAELKQEKKMDEGMFNQALGQRGISLADYKDRLSKQILISKLFNAEVRLKVIITPEEVDEYYQGHLGEYTIPERIKIRHILFLKKDVSEEAVRAQAEKVADLLVAGADFQIMARQYSQDSSQYKGDVSGWIQRGDSLPELEKTIFGLEPGVISPVIESSVGFHLIKVEAKEPTRVRPREEVAPEITSKLTEEKTASRHKEWMDELKRQAAIEIKL